MDGYARSYPIAPPIWRASSRAICSRAINGRPVRDLVDYQFYAAEEELLLGVERNGRAHRDAGRQGRATRGWAFSLARSQRRSFASAPTNVSSASSRGCRSAASRSAVCRWACARSLYIKDDDYRYSFLFGNFITLTNLKEQDWRRLEEQRLSPLYVSVHTTDPDLRRKMVDGPRSGEIVEQIERLGDLGISVPHAARALPRRQRRRRRWIAALRSGGAAPDRRVDLGRAGRADEIQQHDRGGEPAADAPIYPRRGRRHRGARRGWQRQFAAEPGSGGLPFVYLSDEWYYVTRRPFPPARHYGGYAQIENGVGMTRKLLDDWRRVARRRLPRAVAAGRKVALVTGAMAAPVIARLARDLARIEGLSVRLVPVDNAFFGPTTTVAGLLCGQDVRDELGRSCPDFGPRDLILLPRVVLDNAGKRFLDDVTTEQFACEAPAPVVFVRGATELANAVAALGLVPAGSGA